MIIVWRIVCRQFLSYPCPCSLMTKKRDSQ
ncbi:Uncharacterised protein [Vibrio cholerae]|nr:Uncharacterised protein [Vibrio cholerae]